MEEGFVEMWHGTTLPVFHRIYHDPHKQLHPGSSCKPTGVYLFSSAHKSKAFGYAPCFPVIEDTWCRTVIRCAAFQPTKVRDPHTRKKIRLDQSIAQEVYMSGAEVMVLHTRAIDNTDHVVGIDDDGMILNVTM